MAELMAIFGLGAGLGLAFVAGLAWSVRHGTATDARPAWYVGSFLVRAVLVVGVLAIATGGDGTLALTAFAGFMIVRPLAVRWCLPGEAAHAPQP